MAIAKNSMAGAIAGSFAAGSDIYADLKTPPVRRMEEATKKIKASDASALAAQAVGAIAGMLNVGQVIGVAGDVVKITPYKAPKTAGPGQDFVTQQAPAKKKKKKEARYGNN